MKTFYQFYKERLTPTADGVHKECRANDPDNCRKCHTGRFSGKGGSGKDKEKGGEKEPWKVFKRGNKELYAYTVRGEGSGEEESMKRQLAEENGCKPEDIDVIEEKRDAVRGEVPGEATEMEDILSDIAKKHPECEVSDLDVVKRSDGTIEISGGMINADDQKDVDNSLWMIRRELLKKGYFDMSWDLSGDFGFFFKCRKKDK